MNLELAWKSPLQKWFGVLGYQVRKMAPPELPAEVPPEPELPPEPAQPELLPNGMMPGTPLPLWENDEAYQVLRRQMVDHTVVGEGDAYLLYQLAAQVRGLDGDAAEVGVYKGGTARMLAKTLEPYGKRVHLFDTFDGMPTPDPERDYHKAGDFGDTSVEFVREYLADCPNVAIYPGLFPSTAEPIADRDFCLVHVDVDIYQSVLDCCRVFYPRLVRGGALVFDDYGRLSCPGARAAVDEYFADRPERPVYLTTAQAFVVKL